MNAKESKAIRELREEVRALRQEITQLRLIVSTQQPPVIVPTVWPEPQTWPWETGPRITYHRPIYNIVCAQS